MKQTELAMKVLATYLILVVWLTRPHAEPKPKPKPQGEPIVQIYTDHGIVTKAKR